MTSTTVESADFRAALAAVVPHAGIPKDPSMHRVRLSFGTQLVSVTACNRVTAAHAIVSVEETDLDDEADEAVDLSPADAKAIISLFKGGGEGDDENQGDLLTLRLDEGELSITDSGGLFDGKSLVLPGFGTPAHYPSIPHLLKGLLHRKHKPASAINLDATRLALFAHAAKAYGGQSLTIEPGSDITAVLVSCGESFLGAVMPIRLEETSQAEHKEWREAWCRRFDELPANSLHEAVENLARSGVESVSFTPAGGETTTVDVRTGEISER